VQGAASDRLRQKELGPTGVAWQARPSLDDIGTEKHDKLNLLVHDSC
jgi:hypothetical protein